MINESKHGPVEALDAAIRKFYLLIEN